MNYLIFFSIYLLVSIALYRIAKRLDAPHPYMAAVPIAREWLLVSMSGKSWKWFVLILIPVVNIVAAWLVWGGVAQKLDRSAWLGRFMIFPLMNILLMCVLAFGITRDDVKRWGKATIEYVRSKLNRQHNSLGNEI